MCGCYSTIIVILLSFPFYSRVQWKLIGAVKLFTTILLQYLCIFISELSDKVRRENSAMNKKTATHCVLKNLWGFPCSFLVLNPTPPENSSLLTARPSYDL